VAQPAARVLVVSPRPARPDGRGDQRRTSEIIAALAEEYDVATLSWLPDVGARDWRPAGGRGATARRVRGIRWIRAAGLATVLPSQVAYVQSLAPRSFRRSLEGYDLVVFVTDRAVPWRLPGGASVVDFIDDLGRSARRRGRASTPPIGWFWRIEGGRLRRFDRRLAAAARLCVAHSAADAAGIHPAVQWIPLSVGTQAQPERGGQVVFFGNLFYAPNHEAAMWICSHLAPALAARGVGPDRIVVAGRLPRPALVDAARTSGIDLRPDLADLHAVLPDAAVVVVPMLLGTGSLYKVLDACGAQRACVLTPVANAGLGLVDDVSAVVRDRSPDLFAEAVVELLDDPVRRSRLAAAARAHIEPYLPDQVAARWRCLVRRALEAP